MLTQSGGSDCHLTCDHSNTLVKQAANDIFSLQSVEEKLWVLPTLHVSVCVPLRWGSALSFTAAHKHVLQIEVKQWEVKVAVSAVVAFN